MSILVRQRFVCHLHTAVMLLVTLVTGSLSMAQPANRPLLVNQSGARPNLMVSIDNSGSMSFTYHESYNITDDDEYQKKQCPSPYSNSSSTTLSTFNAGIGGEAVYNSGTWTCYERYFSSGSWRTRALTGVAVAYSPDQGVYEWSAQRSSDVNPIYYNPRVRYLPRVDGSGTARVPTDGVKFVSNQNSVNFTYDVLQRTASPYDYRYYHSMYANGTQTPQGFSNDPAPTGFASRYKLQYSLRIPQHIAYTNPGGATPAFTYTYCTSIVTNASGQETGCANRTKVDVVYGSSATYTIVGTHNRTDCSGNVCTSAQEITNILNWFRWYSTRQLATSTAIGLALADVDTRGRPNIPSRFDGQLRIGYMPINDTTIPNGILGSNTNLMIQNTPGSPASTIAVSRGVRTLERGTTANTQLFSWLDNLLSRGTTPLHNAIIQAANYYRMQNGVTENPWRTDPTSSSSSEMTCRRSFNLLFSDGGWTSAVGSTNVAPHPAGPDYDNLNGPLFTQTLADGTTNSFQYLKDGINTAAGRLRYVPFANSDIGGLADLAAYYYWHLDMRPTLANNIQTRPGQPTFWQNMATYTVGYQVQPTGEVKGTGLTFAQIDKYITDYTLGNTVTKPTWPTGNLLDDSTTTNQERVDDFIHAGYSGGARSFSARTADDVKSIFNIILAEIVSAAGKDAGVSVSSGGDSSTLAGQLKYTVSYRTMDNSGNIVARELDAAGNETGVTRWSAEPLMPAASLRRVFAMHSANQPIDFIGTFGSLPTDIQNALKQGPDASRVASDAGFINYLRGDNSVTDSANRLFRQRVSKIAAMVNPPSELMNYSRDYQYDTVTSGSGVDGWDSYNAFAGRKLGYPASLFVATNAGEMHSFDATTGVEQAAFMPRRSMTRLLNFAAEPYNFEYVLDGPISQNDIFNRPFANQQSLTVADQWKAWRHIAVGTGGRGQPLIYAVNSPINPGTPPSRIPNKEDFLWETGPDVVNNADGNDVAMGYIATPARSGQTEDNPSSNNSQRGRWIIAVNNGYYNGMTDGSKAGLIVLDALTGSVIRTIPLPAGYSAGRGLSGVTLLRNYNQNHRVVAAYAGDANGQLWRFNLTGDPSTWHVEHNRPLFTVPGNRPIFGAPAWQPHDLKNPWTDGFMVVFATGFMMEEGDLDDLGAQAIYGIWDQQNADGTMADGVTFTEVLSSQLQQQNVVSTTATDRGNVTYYGITDNTIDWRTQRGWFMPLENVHQTDDTLRAGERSIAQVQNIGSSVLITTTVLRRPANTEMCMVTELPANYVYLLDARTASATNSRSFDVTGDSRLDPFAVAFLSSGGFTRGVSVTKYYSRPDGSPLTTYTLPSPSSISDPYINPDVINRPMGIGADGEYETPASSGCKNMRAKILGTETTALAGGVSCPVTGWRRTEFQLSSPPTN